MENRVVTWNDQVASRRRGISGRFMSLSKRWTSFGSSKHAATGSSTAANSSGSNYDHQRGFYPPETPEATMRQLGDYAFMLRDYRLAYSTYDFLRTDFNHDKAWAYHAASNEMSAITSLLIPQTLGSKSRSENVDQMLDTAAYSYLTRCSMPKNVVRCLTLATELLKSRGPVAVDDAARWGGKLLELGVLSSFAQTLMTERLADCYASRNNATAPFPRARKRQAALWNLLASESWVRLDRSAQARFRFQLATELYEHDGQANKVTPFASMQLLWHRLGNGLHNEALNESLALIDLGNSDSLDNSPYQESEQLNTITKSEYVTQPETADFTPQGAGRSDAIGSGGSGLLSDGFE